MKVNRVPFIKMNRLCTHLLNTPGFFSQTTPIYRSYFAPTLGFHTDPCKSTAFKSGPPRDAKASCHVVARSSSLPGEGCRKVSSFEAKITSWWLNHPSDKYASQTGSFPQIGMKIKNVWNHHADYFLGAKKMKKIGRCESWCQFLS